MYSNASITMITLGIRYLLSGGSLIYNNERYFLENEKLVVQKYNKKLIVSNQTFYGVVRILSKMSENEWNKTMLENLSDAN